MVAVLIISATAVVNAASNDITNFSVKKEKVSSTKYKITVKATYPKNCKRRYMGAEAGPVYNKGIEFGAAKKSTTKKWSTSFTKKDYEKAVKDSRGRVSVYVWAGCACDGWPVKGKTIYIKF